MEKSMLRLHNLTTMIPLRVAVLQLNPRIGNVKGNIERANSLLKSFTKPVDLLVLPEFSFTGYNFQSRAEVEPYLEPTTDGLSTQWAKDVSKRLQCHTIVGYPEVTKESMIYNSAALTSPVGEVVHNFRKSFLYMIDEGFECQENPNGFECVRLPLLHNLKLQLGLCMDINPYKFEAPFDKYEFANSSIDNDASIVVAAMCWTHNQSPSIYPEQVRGDMKKELQHNLDPTEIDLKSVNYWLQRMMPYLTKTVKQTCFVAADRCGWEDDVLFAGSSSVFTFKGDESQQIHEKVTHYGSLAQMEEAILYFDNVQVSE